MDPEQMNKKLSVKICGITNIGDALEACGLGADMLGFIFVESSPRYILPGSAERIIAELPSSVVPVGIFADMETHEIESIIASTGIKILQLHGNETPEEVSGYKVPVIKSFRVGSGFDTLILKKYHPYAYLLDTYSPGIPGGTGKIFDWEIAVQAKTFGRVILAGGLNPGNIAEAVKKTAPYAVDVNSGVESRPGKKDALKLKMLFQNLREFV
jgi:phosphoribosylanthranilate isomerase